MTLHRLTLSPLHLPTFVAQARSAGTAQVQVVVWVVVLIAVVLVAFGVLYFVHKKLFGENKDSVDHEGLMETMRKMKARGDMSPEEFDQAKRALQRKTVADVEAKLAARQRADSPDAKREAAQAAAQRIIDAGKPPNRE